MIYIACAILGLVGVAVAMAQDTKQFWIILGAAIYGVALFAAAIHSMGGP